MKRTSLVSSLALTAALALGSAGTASADNFGFSIGYSGGYGGSCYPSYPTYSYPTYSYPVYSYPVYSYPTYSYPTYCAPSYRGGWYPSSFNFNLGYWGGGRGWDRHDGHRGGGRGDGRGRHR